MGSFKSGKYDPKSDKSANPRDKMVEEALEIAAETGDWAVLRNVLKQSGSAMTRRNQPLIRQ